MVAERTIEQTITRRPTPADPMPGVAREARAASSDTHDLPPELGPDAVAVVEGHTFMYSDQAGDVPPGSIGGLVSADTRLLNCWVLTVNGSRLLAVRSGVGEHYEAAFFLTNPALPELPANTLGIRRRRLVGDLFRERVEVQSFADDLLHVQVRLDASTDFADLLEIKDRVQRRPAVAREHSTERMTFRYDNRGFTVETALSAIPAADRMDGDGLIWDIDLVPNGVWSVDLEIPLRRGPREVSPARRHFGDEPTCPPCPRDPIADWLAETPDVSSDSYPLEQVVDRSKRDLASLRVAVPSRGDEEVYLPAAGLPWYLTLIGRDTLITAYQVIGAGTSLAKGALIALAELQGRSVDDVKDEQPGKIAHELRSGELTRLGEQPYDPYYGTVDATMLWLILLSEYWRWTGDDGFVRALGPQAMAALDWIDGYGDLDGDGYVEYQTRSPQGLGNQCWRDSWNGVLFADGSMPTLPIATCETQGYVYDAKLRMADLMDGPLADPIGATRLRAEAVVLADRFNEEFWISGRGGYYALGLDGDKRPIDSMTSNMGHLLWSGIVPPGNAALVVRQLMSDELFSGWGVRTLSTRDSGYNPIGYHLGTVWPHDNSLIAAGLARYGYRAEANRIAMALLDAARFTDHRLPEALSGYARDFAAFPVPYPTACSPRAWASGAPLLCLRTMLGLDIDGGQVTIDPALPDEIGRIAVRRLQAFDNRWDVEASGTRGQIRLSQ